MIDKLINPATKIISKYIKDKDLELKLQHEMQTLFHQANLAQIEVNKIEAKGSAFQRNWRPFVGWICGLALAYHFCLAPILEVIIKTNGIDIVMPEFDFSQLSAILMALLGMSGLRSYDKLKKTDTK
tara:strand:- start:1092 stop:1472 length:381 start_codon:yes stop_codon:yes gene_type:complete